MSGQLNKSNTLTTSDSFVLNGSPLILIITSALFETKLEAIWVTSIGPQENNIQELDNTSKFGGIIVLTGVPVLRRYKKF